MAQPWINLNQQLLAIPQKASPIPRCTSEANPETHISRPPEPWNQVSGAGKSGSVNVRVPVGLQFGLGFGA